MTILDRLKATAIANGAFELDIRSTYFALRLAAGLIGLLLPVILIGWGLWHHVSRNDMTSLSAFYWLSLLSPIDPNALLRNWFVGSLIAEGTCLVIYKGYGNLENWLLNLAGLAAVVVALNPMACRNVTALTPMQCLQQHEDNWHVHYPAAIIFFLMIGATIWFCADDTLTDLDTEVQSRWRLYYKTFAIAMVAAPLIAFLFAEEDVRTIWVEIAGVWVFSWYWFAKTYELSRVSMLEPPSGPSPRVRRLGGRLEVLRSGSSDVSSLRQTTRSAPPF
jgi:hypothetical protein